MAAQQQDPKVTEAAAATCSPREVQVEDSLPGMAGAGAGVGAAHGPPSAPEPPGRRPFMEQFDFTPNRDRKIKDMEKKHADLEATIKELTKDKTNKDEDKDDESLKPFHSKDMWREEGVPGLASELHIHIEDDDRMDEGGGADQVSTRRPSTTSSR